MKRSAVPALRLLTGGPSAFLGMVGGRPNLAGGPSRLRPSRTPPGDEVSALKVAGSGVELWDDVDALGVEVPGGRLPLGTLGPGEPGWLPLRLSGDEHDEDHDGSLPVSIFTPSSVPRPRPFLALVVLALTHRQSPKRPSRQVGRSIHHSSLTTRCPTAAGLPGGRRPGR